MSDSDVMGAVKGDSATKALFSARADALKPLEASAAEVKQRGAETRDVITKSRADADRAAADTGALTPPKLEPAPTPKPTDLMTQFGSPAMFIAALGSRLTRTPLTSSLNASAAVMQAFKKKDYDTAQQQFDIWKTDTDNAMKLHEFQMESYKAALSKADKDQNAALAEFTTYASAFKDDTALTMARVGGIDAAIRHQESMAKMGADLAASRPKLEEQHERMQALGAMTKARDELLAQQKLNDPVGIQNATERLTTAQQRLHDVNAAFSPMFAAVDEKATTSTDPVKAFVAEWKSAHNGESPPAEEIAKFKSKMTSPRSAPAMAMQQFIRDFSESHDGAQPSAEDLMGFAASYRARGAAEQSFASGGNANTVRSLNVATAHLDTLRELSLALKNSDVKSINKLKNELGTQFGAVDPGNFDLAKKIVSDEVLKAVIGNGAGTGVEREALQADFDKAKNFDQISGVVDTAERLMAGQVAGQRQQYERTTKKTDFDEQFLLPRTREVMNRHKSDLEKNSGPPPDAVADLKAGRGTDDQFDKIFGAGAAKKARGQ